MKIYMVSLLHRATITNHSMKIYMVSLLHRATINNYHSTRKVAPGDEIIAGTWRSQVLDRVVGLVSLPLARCRRRQITWADAAAGKMSIPHHSDGRVVDHADDSYRHSNALRVDVHRHEETENGQSETERTHERARSCTV